MSKGNIVGLDGSPASPAPKPREVFDWTFERKDGKLVEATGYFQILGGFYPAILTGEDDDVQIEYFIHPEQLVDVSKRTRA